jgi:hypothetical protein
MCDTSASLDARDALGFGGRPGSVIGMLRGRPVVWDSSVWAVTGMSFAA